MGIVGFGEIGRAVAKLANAFGMEVIAATRSRGEHPNYVGMVELDALFPHADVVSLHCPLTPDTEGMVNEARLKTMKRTAFLINTSRGQLIDEPALAAALTKGEIAGGGARRAFRRTSCGGSPFGFCSKLFYHATSGLGYAECPDPLDASRGGECCRLSGGQSAKRGGVNSQLYSQNSSRFSSGSRK